jgi:predicted DNA-binding transcriptional regulator AlpA
MNETDDEVLLFAEVCQRLRITIRSGRRLRRAKRFPPALMLGPRCLRWSALAVKDWLAGRREPEQTNLTVAG